MGSGLRRFSLEHAEARRGPRERPGLQEPRGTQGHRELPEHKGAAGATGTAGATGATGSAGATGATGASPDAGAGSGPVAFSLIEPRVGLTGRELDVTVSVDEGGLNASAAIDFGDPKVAVSAVTLVSPTTLYAHLTIDAAATLGAHDVTITDGALSVKGTAAFNVSPPITVTLTAGSAQQGSVFSADIHSLDTANFFDANAANFTVTGSDGLASLGNSNITPNDLSALILVPPASFVSNAQFTVQNDPSSSLSWVSAPDAVAVTAQSPTALTLPYTKTGATLAAAGDSVYESASSPGIGILNYTIDVTDANSPFLPEGVVFPESGQLSDIVAVLAPPVSLFGPAPPLPPHRQHPQHDRGEHGDVGGPLRPGARWRCCVRLQHLGHQYGRIGRHYREGDRARHTGDGAGDHAPRDRQRHDLGER